MGDDPAAGFGDHHHGHGRLRNAALHAEAGRQLPRQDRLVPHGHRRCGVCLGSGPSPRGPHGVATICPAPAIHPVAHDLCGGRQRRTQSHARPGDLAGLGPVVGTVRRQRRSGSRSDPVTAARAVPARPCRRGQCHRSAAGGGLRLDVLTHRIPGSSTVIVGQHEFRRPLHRNRSASGTGTVGVRRLVCASVVDPVQGLGRVRGGDLCRDARAGGQSGRLVWCGRRRRCHGLGSAARQRMGTAPVAGGARSWTSESGCRFCAGVRSSDGGGHGGGRHRGGRRRLLGTSHDDIRPGSLLARHAAADLARQSGTGG